MKNEDLIDKICLLYGSKISGVSYFKYNLMFSVIIFCHDDNNIFIMKDEPYVLYKNVKRSIPDYVLFLEKLDKMKAFW